MNITIIIPIKLYKNDRLDDFVNYIFNITEHIKNDNCQIIIADESKKSIYNYIDSHLINCENVIHFVPEDSIRTGDNDKLNGVYDSIKYVKYDKIILIDDHFRITRNTLISLNKCFEKYDCFKTMPKFDKFPISVLIDLCGMFVVNVLDHRKQYCGHLAFRKEHIEKAGFPNRDALFDELAIEKQLRRFGCSVGFIKGIGIEAIQQISLRKFFEQRVRYAYENFAIPLRFTFFASILPILTLFLIINIKLALWFMLCLTIGVTIIGAIGQVIYGIFLAPIYTFLLSPVWFWFYPFTTLISIYKYFSGGIVFGGRKVRSAL